MATARSVYSVIESKPTIEGAGVHLRRVFGFGDTLEHDPFLLMDDFRGEESWKYKKGFPSHPHRGIETITYVLAGTVKHSDSLGNKGTIRPGEIQWMTAGSGIIHEEMPKGDEQSRMHGFQLWVNLPKKAKMMKPRYQEVKAATIPVVTLPEGGDVRVIAGQFQTTKGPVKDLIVDVEYFDVTLPPKASFEHPVAADRIAFMYIIAGEAGIGGQPGRLYGNYCGITLKDGDLVAVTASTEGTRFLLISGKPLNEPVAWGGPIVMNTEEELKQAFKEYQAGTFIKD